jgi:co-chaperonin GroES (HSP10)
MDLEIEPLQSTVIIEPMDLNLERSTAGGIIIPKTVKPKTADAIVLAIGPGEDSPFFPQLKPGMKVCFNNQAFREDDIVILASGKKVLIMHESNIFFHY